MEKVLKKLKRSKAVFPKETWNARHLQIIFSEENIVQQDFMILKIV